MFSEFKTTLQDDEKVAETICEWKDHIYFLYIPSITSIRSVRTKEQRGKLTNVDYAETLWALQYHNYICLWRHQPVVRTSAG